MALPPRQPPRNPDRSRTAPESPAAHRPAVETERPQYRESERSERIYQELKGVEERAQTATQKAVADLSAVYERHILELRGELTKRDEVIRDLQDQARQGSMADLDLSRELAKLRIEMTAAISSAVTIEVSKTTVSPLEAKTIVQGENKTNRVWAGVVASIVATVFAGLTAGVQKSCAEPSVSVPDTRPRAAGTGYAGTP